LQGAVLFDVNSAVILISCLDCIYDNYWLFLFCCSPFLDNFVARLAHDCMSCGIVESCAVNSVERTER
jgi:hypothetical protein